MKASEPLSLKVLRQRLYSGRMRAPYPFAEIGSCFQLSAQGWDFDHYFSALRPTRQVSLKSTEKILPCAAGPGSPTRASRGGVEIRAQLLPESPRGPQHARFPRVGVEARLAFWDEMQRSARKKHQTTPLLFPVTIGGHEHLSSLTSHSVSRRCNSRRLFDQLAPRFDTVFGRSRKRRAGGHGPDQRHV